MILLFDVGNTNTHLGLADGRRVLRQANIATSEWFSGSRIRDQLLSFARRDAIEGVVLCSVMPRATPMVLKAAWELWRRDVLELTPRTLRGVGIDYPRPSTIGPDRLANSVAARHHCGAPVVVVDFGTAVTFDVVNAKGKYVGGIIAPGLSAMTDYLHEKTALLPRIRIREIRGTIGRSTEQAMLVGAVHGYRGLVRELLTRLRKELRAPRLPVIATGGCARLIASGLREITHVEPNLTLEGLRLVWQYHVELRSSARGRK
ncbi:MAG TPA: type III pantothenate kinase [Verrucomicrobia bacterium]|nr:type III pantothenate kinase [Verrucomicrobiota bacterium]HOB31772.1 type III pantothenate kinase [Verrucomicrobiota bacterium]HOP97226.1 type III pantothenate kinase [Verrucomicrobiota bacterium]HPU55692.1 type III pantothenate kinase [Verrucomicrobiota bacterium]